eukprot:3600676-Amphidinium_carterae.2
MCSQQDSEKGVTAWPIHRFMMRVTMNPIAKGRFDLQVVPSSPCILPEDNTFTTRTRLQATP